MSDDKIAALEALVAEQGKRLRELEDVREINDCFRKFHWACCGGFNGRQAGGMDALDQLAEDATFEVRGLHEPGKGPKGREQFTEYWDYYYGDAGPLPYVFQVSVSEWVEITGDTAKGWSVQIGLVQFREMKPSFGLSLRINDYVRTDKGWKIKKTTINGGFGFKVDKIEGGANVLNELPPFDGRKPWTYEGQEAKDDTKVVP